MLGALPLIGTLTAECVCDKQSGCADCCDGDQCELGTRYDACGRGGEVCAPCTGTHGAKGASVSTAGAPNQDFCRTELGSCGKNPNKA
jgi:hypothetical protein